MRIVNFGIMILDGLGEYMIGHFFKKKNWEGNYEWFIFTIQVYWKRNLFNAALLLFTF